MKKLTITLALGALMATATHAQVTVEGSKLTDNWSIGINGGVLTPTTHHAFFGSMRPTFGLEIGKQLTPVFGFGLEGRAAINTTPSYTAIDATNLSLLGKVNLMNLFMGYEGTPRFFEVEAIAGTGWAHYYGSGAGLGGNSWTNKFGLNLNFHIDKDRAWQIHIKPAIVYDMDGTASGHSSYFNVNQSALELSAGVTYKFKNSNGTHNFQLANLRSQAEIDDLNARINDLRSQTKSKDQKIAATQTAISNLEAELNRLRNQAPRKEVVVETKSQKSMESVVTFRQGKSMIDKAQQPNVERIATYMRNHPEAKVIIKGYASPEGSAEINAKIATARAEAVKSMLIKTYGISANRIQAMGEGVGHMFSEPDWNRVSICTLEDNK